MTLLIFSYLGATGQTQERRYV